MDKIKTYKRLSKSLAQVLSLTKMYKFEHPMVREKFQNVYNEISAFFHEHKQSLVLAKSADMLLMNGEKIEPDDKLMIKFIEDFIGLDIGSIELEVGFQEVELEMFMHLLRRDDHITGAEAIKKFLAEKKSVHLIARAAIFKLVQENEAVVKKGEFIKVEDIPPQILQKFSKDFLDGKVPDTLKSADKDYKIAAHNSTFLAGLTFDLIKDKDAPEDLEKILWLLADYLIDEIGTSKEENINKEVLEEIKTKLLSRWKEDPGKKLMQENMEKTYIVINAALELKGLLTLYKKHKKELEGTVNKLKKIMKNLPTDSQLYKKTLKNLMDIGLVSVDENSFR